MGSDQYEYLVKRPQIQSNSDPDSDLENILNLEGAGGWILLTLLPEKVASDMPYLAVFYRKKLGT